jgi:hypothetical protein
LFMTDDCVKGEGEMGIKTGMWHKRDVGTLVFSIFSFLVVPGFGLRISCLLGGHCTNWVTPPAFFALVIFQIVFLSQLALDHDPPTSASYMAGLCHYAWLVCWDKVSLSYCLNPRSPHFHLRSRWDYRCEPPHLALLLAGILYQEIW